MPYLVLRGTRCRVITPQGKVIDPYTCRENTTFTNDQTAPYGPHHLQFERDGFRVIVATSSAIPIELSCADCGKVLTLPSLCETCEKLGQGR
jgi:hypothetical protein